MILIFKLILLTTMIVMTLKVVLSKDMLLENLGKWLEYKASDKYEDGELIEKGNKFYDLFICPFCMNTIQSITAHAFAFGLGILPLEFNWQLFLRWPLVIFGAAALSGFTWTLYETVNRIKDRNEAEENFYNISIEEMIERNDSDFDEDGYKKKFFEKLKN